MNTIHRSLIAVLGAVAISGSSIALWQRFGPRRVVVSAGAFPEQLVYARSNDDIVNGGVMFMPPRNVAKPVAIIWIHGWGVNFDYPTYVMIGRGLAARGYTCIAGNTRMHDLGTIEGWRFDGKRLRGGGYWGLPSDQVRDLAAWIDFAGQQGFRKVVLVGHSAGWAAVRSYEARTQDPRVIGVVLASGEVRAEMRPPDRQELADANRMMAAGRPDDLVRIPNRTFPSYISAATFLDIANTPADEKDFFGELSSNAGVKRISCPLLAFFGARGDVGTEADLRLLETDIRRLHAGPRRIDTAMIPDADHMYTGEEQQVAETIARWADGLR